MTDSMQPLVTVLIPAYNSADFICRSVQSALDQKDIDLEVLVIDDGSTDQTVELLKQIKDSRLRALPLGENKGVSYARNYGIKQSNGKYISFLDADDEYLPGRILKLVQPLEENPEIGMSWCYAYILHQDGSKEPRNFKRESRRLFPGLLWNMKQCTPATLCRKDLLLKLDGFREDLICFEDRDMWIRMREAASDICIEEFLIYVHRRKSSVSHTMDWDLRVNSYFDIVNKALERNEKISSDDRKKIRANCCFEWGKRYSRIKEKKKARAYFFDCLRNKWNWKTFRYLIKTIV